MLKAILNALNVGVNNLPHEQDQQQSADTMDFEFAGQQPEENISWPYWGSLPQPIKSNVASFLNRHEVSMLSRINREANQNKIIFLCESLARNPEQIRTTDDLTACIAQLLKLKCEDISGSERFETLMIKFIQKLEPQQTPFLTPDIDVTNQAHYNFFQAYDQIAFQYNKLNKDENIAMAKVLEQYFSGANLRLVQLKQNDPYYISINKKVFLQHILPWLFRKEGKPQKKIPNHEPEVIDYALKKPDEKKYYWISRRDGKPLTPEDQQKICSSFYQKK